VTPSASQSDYRDSTENHQNGKPACTIVRDLANHFSKLRSVHGKHLYFLSTTYRSPRDNLLTAPSANQLLRKFHICLLEHLAGSRRTGRPWFRAIEPQLHAFLDIPNSKPKQRTHFTTRFINSLFHHHSILVADPRHAPILDVLTDPVISEAITQQWVPRCHLLSLDIQPIGPNETDLAKVVDYATHHARKFFHTDKWDEMYLAFPKSDSEFLRPTRSDATAKHEITKYLCSNFAAPPFFVGASQ
jgi:hypothetical protein